MNKTLHLAFALFLALSTPASAQVPNKPKLDQFFDRLIEKNQAMGSLTIAKDGKVLYTRTIGYAKINGTDKKPLTPATRFRIGSITKMFTTVMIMQLIEEGKLKSTDTLDKFFPQIPNAKKITIAHILQHRSGIPNVQRPQNAQGNVNMTPITIEEKLALIANATPDFEPDSKHLYSNSGYFILGLILEKVTAKPYAEILKEKITSKIGLKETYIATGSIDVNNNEALTYINLGGNWKQGPETHPSNLFGAGAIISTPNDLATFINCLFDLKLVSQQSLTSMKSIRDGDGFGMEPFSFAGKTFYGHTGGADNYGAWLAYLPEEKLAVAYTTNAKVWPVVNILKGVVDIYYNQPFEIPTFQALAISPEILEKYVGVYSHPQAPVKFTITRDGGTLFIKDRPQSTPIALEALAENKFKIAGSEVLFDPTKNEMTLKRAGRERVFTREK